MLPTRIIKPKVFKIQASRKREKKSSYKALKESRKRKLFKIRTPRSVPEKRDSITFFVRNAKKIARSEGNKEK